MALCTVYHFFSEVYGTYAAENCPVFYTFQSVEVALKLSILWILTQNRGKNEHLLDLILPISDL